MEWYLEDYWHKVFYAGMWHNENYPTYDGLGLY